MMAAGKARTEVACCLSWFRNWDMHQRQEFARVMKELVNPGHALQEDVSVDDLMGQLSSLSVSQKLGPSVFECQLKIFQKWFPSWTYDDRTQFTCDLNTIDPLFIQRLQNPQALNHPV